jgi:hypothetical protein
MIFNGVTDEFSNKLACLLIKGPISAVRKFVFKSIDLFSKVQSKYIPPVLSFVHKLTAYIIWLIRDNFALIAKNQGD